jgi:hypothetical protein
VSTTDLTAQPCEPDPAEPGYAALFSAVPRIRVALTGPDERVRLQHLGWVDLATLLAERAVTHAHALGGPAHVAAAA